MGFETMIGTLGAFILGCLGYKVFVEPRKWMKNHANGNEGTVSQLYRKHLHPKQ